MYSAAWCHLGSYDDNMVPAQWTEAEDSLEIFYSSVHVGSELDTDTDH